jgi:hypothetical protein
MLVRLDHEGFGGIRTGTFSVSTSFGGRPIGRKLASSPNTAAVTAVHVADPNGAPRFTLCRMR